MLLSEIIGGHPVVPVVNIQSNWGVHPGYVGQVPIATSGGKFLFATDERCYSHPDRHDEAATEYDGFWVENDLGVSDKEAFSIVKKITGV